MIVQEPIPHWNNFTVPELKDILEHCSALERLGITQDEEMMISIKRDISLRKKKLGELKTTFEPKSTKLEMKVQDDNKPKKIARKMAPQTNREPPGYLLEQTI